MASEGGVLNCGNVDLGDKDKYIIDGHGCLDDTTFRIPEGYYFITLAPVGESISTLKEIFFRFHLANLKEFLFFHLEPV